MNRKIGNSAILFFSNSPEMEVRKKRFSPSTKYSENKKLAELLISHNVEICRKTSLPIELIDSKRQRGQNFGERLKNAFLDVFSKGYQNVIVIGSDCLEIYSNELRKAEDLVSKGHPVLGPCDDGGIYLLAINRKQFDTLDFSKIDWCTSRVYFQLRSIFNENWLCKSFKRKSDIDSSDDLKKFISTNRKYFTTGSLKIIVSLVICFFRFKRMIFKLLKGIYHSVLPLRGPPPISNFY